MPRDGSNIYSVPAGSTATPGTTIESAKYNALAADIAADLNLARPIVAGGTGATTAAGILAATGVTASVAEVNTLDGITATTAELNILDGVTATTTELNYVDGVTSAIQTQLDAKQPLDADLTQIAGITRARGSLIRGGASAWEGVALGASGTVLTSDGTDAAWAAPNNAITWEAETALSGAAPITFSTTLPATATEIYCAFRGPSLSGTDHFLIQLGTAGSWITSGYDSVATVSGGASGSTIETAGAALFGGNGSRNLDGVVTFLKTNATNRWFWTIGGHDGLNAALGGGGQVSTTDQPTRIRINVTGSNTFSSGNIRVGYR